MSVLVAVIATAVVAGVLGALVARRWPRLDPAAPRVDASSPTLQAEVIEHPRLRMLLRRHVDPVAATSLAIVVCVAATLLLATVIGALLLMVQTHSGLAKWDLAFARWGAAHATPLSTSVMRDVSLLGGTAGAITIAIVAGVYEYRRRPNRAIPALVTLTVVGQFLIVNVIKGIVDRDRPAIDRLTGFSGGSFPSGHAAAAAATFAVVGLLVGRGRSRTARNVIAGVVVGLAVLVAASRVMLGVHWLTDVIAGIAVGWAWLAVCSIAFGGRLVQFGAPVAAATTVADHGRGTISSAAPGTST